MNNNVYKHCSLCPRNCGVNRLSASDQKGYCRESRDLRLAAAGLHKGEEPPITGSGGSGTIFVSGCNLGCSICQNYQISQQGMGRTVEKDEFVQICLVLQAKGAENINIVTGSHSIPQIASAICHAKEKGLTIPVLWNSSAYETTETLDLLRDCIGIYLPDLKTLDPLVAKTFFNAPDYPDFAQKAILKMLDTKTLAYKDTENTVLRSGVLIRHLVLPEALDSTRTVLRWFGEHAQGRALLSLMTQYTPVNNGGPNRYLNENEYDTVLQWLSEYDGFYQELSPKNDWLPDFTRLNPFSSDLSLGVWHWTKGFV
ncbi:radical SAM protein [Breznakiellaceae bacterium SP9]